MQGYKIIIVHLHKYYSILKSYHYEIFKDISCSCSNADRLYRC